MNMLNTDYISIAISIKYSELEKMRLLNNARKYYLKNRCQIKDSNCQLTDPKRQINYLINCKKTYLAI